jgi:carboxyl-terminal processing protease
MTTRLLATPSSRLRSPGKPVRSALFGIAMLATLASPAAASLERVADWTKALWNSATQGDGQTVRLLSTMPDAGDPAVERLEGLVEGYVEHIGERQEARDQRLAELRAELDDALAQSDYEEAMRLLLEKQDVEGDPENFVGRPEVGRVIQQVANRAAQFEADRDWLHAFRLYAALHVLHEPRTTFEEEWRRLSQRRRMIGFYAPEVLYDMVSEERVADGEDPLPPFNETGPTWRDRIEGLRPDMVSRAIKRAADAHIDAVPIREMLKGGFHALRVMATTPELATAMPALDDEDARTEFIEQVDLNLRVIERLDRRLSNYDVDRALSVVARSNRETINVPIEALLHEFGNGAAERLDEYSEFYWPESIERANRTTQGNFKGVGIQITQNDALELEVVTPVAGTPAFRAGVRPGDIIAEIDGESAIGLGVNAAVERITGPAGSQVKLGIERESADEFIEYTLTREVIPLYAARGWKRVGADEREWDWFVDKEAGIGYLRLSQFLLGATRQTEDAIRSMRRQGLNALILDLRYNSGGLLDEAVSMTNLFVDGGVVVTQEDARGIEQDRQVARRGRAMIDDLPIVVLVNGGSASASEIVAGALQDYDKAVLVGTRTYGKGSVQRIFPLDRRGRAAFKLTTQYYKLPGGRLIHRRPGKTDFGIAPDVEIRMTPSEISEALELRRDADVISVDEQGNTILEGGPTDPAALVAEGVDPQLQTAVLLLKAKVVGDRLSPRVER